MLPLDNYKKWCALPDKPLKETVAAHISVYGTSREIIADKLKAMETWLIANAHTKKANKRNWHKFVLNWLKPRDWDKPREPFWWEYPEDKPQRAGGRSGIASIKDILQTTAIGTIPMRTERMEQKEQHQHLPLVSAVLGLKCQKCGQTNVPALHPLGDIMVCAYCHCKATDRANKGDDNDCKIERDKVFKCDQCGKCPCASIQSYKGHLLCGLCYCKATE